MQASQDAFLRQMEVLMEKESSMEIEIYGDFHTEEEMRTNEQIPERLAMYNTDPFKWALKRCDPKFHSER